MEEKKMQIVTDDALGTVSGGRLEIPSTHDIIKRVYGDEEDRRKRKSPLGLRYRAVKSIVNTVAKDREQELDAAVNGMDADQFTQLNTLRTVLRAMLR